MAVTICHASIDEHNSAKNGAAGDQTGKEVCTRDWYSKPWRIMLRYKDANIAKQAAAIAVKLANSNLVGYDQNQRNTLYQALKKNNFNVDAYIKSGVKTETDCSAFVYACYCCVISGMRADGNAPTTSSMKSFYLKYGFTVYTSSTYVSSSSALQVGDVLVKPGSHTVMVAGGTSSGSSGSTSQNTSNTTTNSGNCYAAYTGSSTSIADALNAIGIDGSFKNRSAIASANGISNYRGTAAQNSQLLTLLKAGKLIKAGESTSASTVAYYPATNGTGIADALNSIGADGSFAHRQKIAAANGISNYKGTASQNTQLLNLLKAGKLIKA